MPASPENIQAYLETYLSLLPVELADGPQGEVLPGVLKILQTLQQDQTVVQGLLTGNQARGAEYKLSHYRVWDYFEFGAYADDSADRNELGPHAQRRAKETHGVDFAPERTYIVGDTPFDIECGKVINAQTIAVATGGYTRDELIAHEPTALFDDLTDSAAFYRALGIE